MENANDSAVSFAEKNSKQSETTSLAIRPFPLLALLESYQQSVSELFPEGEGEGESLWLFYGIDILILPFR